MLRTVGLGKGGAGRTQLRVDTLRAQTDEWATCALGPRAGLGCWLSNRKAWQEWEEPDSGRSQAVGGASKTHSDISASLES